MTAGIPRSSQGMEERFFIFSSGYMAILAKFSLRAGLEFKLVLWIRRGNKKRELAKRNSSKSLYRSFIPSPFIAFRPHGTPHKTGRERRMNVVLEELRVFRGMGE
jgi:hypothetical protein